VVVWVVAGRRGRHTGNRRRHPALSTFDGTNPNGAWKLYVVNDTLGSAGQFAGCWSLTIKARVRR